MLEAGASWALGILAVVSAFCVGLRLGRAGRPMLPPAVDGSEAAPSEGHRAITGEQVYQDAVSRCVLTK